jgi:hypothetical protein
MRGHTFISTPLQHAVDHHGFGTRLIAKVQSAGLLQFEVMVLCGCSGRLKAKLAEELGNQLIEANLHVSSP